MLAIVPARSGSKGLPGKNIRPLLGKPLIAYTIEEALACPSISQVIVSTDDPAIAETATRYGATVPFMRPAELAQDTSIAADAYIYTIDRLEKETGKPIASVVILQPTSPLRLASDITSAIKLFDDLKADSVISFTKEDHPIAWHRFLAEDNRIELVNTRLANRQDARPSYYPNGAVMVIKAELLRTQTYYSQLSYAYIMPRDRAVDIDSIGDFELAEFMVKRR